MSNEQQEHRADEAAQKRPKSRVARKLEELAQEAHGLFPIPEAASREYRAKISSLAAQVNESILQSPNVRELIGSCPVDTIASNHNNHARFLATVMTLDLHSLLARVVPWVYRAYTAQGVSYEYFRAELEAWKEAVREQVDDVHADPICRVYDWMLWHHHDMKGLSLEITEVFPGHVDWSETRQVLLDSLLAGDSRRLRDKVEEIAPDAEALPELYVNVLQPVMYRVGDMWAEGEVSVSQEHMATALISRVMAATYERLSIFEPTRGKAVVACATDEFHELGARVVADLLELDGWDVAFLGANVPNEDFHHMVSETQPAIVGLSATLPYHLLRVKDILDPLREDQRLDRTRIMVGGMAFSMAPEAAEKVGADAWARDGKDARQVAARWHEEGYWD